MDFPRTNQNSNWEIIWSWSGQERIKLFIWKLNHGRLLTNERIAKWGSSSDRCTNCPDIVESCLHVFRDCPKAKILWSLPLLQPLPPGFFTFLDFDGWMELNLNQPKVCSVDWRDPFFFVCYFLWIWRNKEHHEENFKRPDNLGNFFATLLEENIALRGSKFRKKKLNAPLSSPASWSRPEEGFLKLNIDGAVSGDRAACGGVLRDNNGCWVGGFSSFLGSCSPLHAELWAILHGLEFSWKLGCRNILVESDSLQAVCFLTSVGNDSRKLPLVAKIRVWLHKDWSVVLSHVPRSINSCTDLIAKSAINDEFGLRMIAHPHPDLAKLMAADILDPG